MVAGLAYRHGARHAVDRTAFAPRPPTIRRDSRSAARTTRIIGVEERPWSTLTHREKAPHGGEILPFILPPESPQRVKACLGTRCGGSLELGCVKRERESNLEENKAYMRSPDPVRLPTKISCFLQARSTISTMDARIFPVQTGRLCVYNVLYLRKIASSDTVLSLRVSQLLHHQRSALWSQKCRIV